VSASREFGLLLSPLARERWGAGGMVLSQELGLPAGPRTGARRLRARTPT